MSVTMEDVARHAAVSTATVSRVINNPDMVNIETRTRVLQAIQALDYRVNITARNLRTRRTQNLAVVVPHLKNPLITDILESLEKAALAEGYTTQLCLTYGDIERVQKYAALLAEKRRIDGVVAVAATLPPDMVKMVHTVSQNTPVLLVNHSIPAIPGLLFDFRDAAYQAVQYLVQKGHRRIACLNLPTDFCFPAKMRLEGYRRALAEAKILDELIYEADAIDDYKANWTHAVEMMLAGTATAVLAYDDQVAVTIYKICKERGIRIPEDLSVIGCGDFPSGQTLEPTLTTIGFPTEQMGDRAFNDLLEHINSDIFVIRETTYLPVTFIERHSC